MKTIDSKKSTSRSQWYLLPSLAGRGLGVGLLLCLSLLCACSSDSDGDGQSTSYTVTSLDEAPVWQIDWTNNQESPGWTALDFSSNYEHGTILKVQIEDELLPYASEGDLIAIFVNDELRGLEGPAYNTKKGQTENGRFLLKAWGNETGSETVKMSLQYYSQTLKHLFELTDYINLNSDVTIGIEDDYIPEFTRGSAKYPVVKTMGVESFLTKAGMTPVSGNMVGAFVGDECRGTVSLATSGSTLLTIYGRTAESVTLKYYDTAAGKLYTVPNAVKM